MTEDQELIDFSKNIADLLNSMFLADPAAMYALVSNRVPCNEKLADHPFAETIKVPLVDHEQYQIGLLGVINCLMNACGIPKVCVAYDKSNQLLGFASMAESFQCDSSQPTGT